MSLRSTRRRRAREAAATRFDGACRFVLGSVREMAQADLIAEIPPAELEAIRAEDPHPLFVAIDVAQEGESAGEMIVNGQSVGNQKKLWGADAIRDFAGKLGSAAMRGLARFWHGDHDRKIEAGRILKSIVKTIGDRVHAIAIGWIHDASVKAAFRAGQVSTGSMEADCQFERDRSSWIVRAVKAVQGIVLGGSGLKPGFAGASVLAAVQELAGDKEDDDVDPLTLRDVQDVIKDNGWEPSKVFDKTVLLGDRIVVDAMKNDVDAAVKKAADAKDKEIESLKADALAHRRAQAQAEVGGLLEKSELMKNVTKGQAAYLARTVRVDLANVPADQRQAKIDAAITEQLAIAKDLGLTFKEPAAGDGSGDKGGGAAGGSGGAASGGNAPGRKLADGTPDMTDPKNNDLLPQ